MNPVRSRRRWIFPFALPLALLAFWFITAPAVPASQCINAGGPPGTCSRFLSNLAEAYSTRALDPAVNAIGELWWRVIDPPDTTP
jgi:hypothetical protein